MDVPDRNQLLVIGLGIFDETEFTRRKLQVHRVTPTDAEAHFNTAKSVMVADAPRKFALIKECFSGLFLRAEDHELLPVVLAHSLEDLVQIAALRDKEHPGSNATIAFVPELWRAAEVIARHHVGPPAGDVIFEPK